MLAQARVSGAIAEAPGLPTRQLIFDYFAGEIFHKADVRAAVPAAHRLPARDDHAHRAQS